MKITVRYYVLQDGKPKFTRTLDLTEGDIEEIVKERFFNDELPCPIHIDKDDVTLDVDVENIKI